jgi:DNA mismatch repair protein MutH
MRGRLNGVIASMTRDKNWVYVTVETIGGAIIDPKSGQDAKASGAEIKIRIKPVLGDQLRFGERIYFNWTTEAPEAEE